MSGSVHRVAARYVLHLGAKQQELLNFQSKTR